MKEHTYFKTTAAILGIVAIVHLARIVQGWEAEIGGWEVPMWASWAALIVAGSLAYSGYLLTNKR